MHPLLSRAEDQQTLAKRCEYRASVLAELCGVSLRTLERMFKRDFGVSPQCWLNMERFGQIERLRKRGVPVKEIVPEVHYGHSSSLCRACDRHNKSAYL